MKNRNEDKDCNDISNYYYNYFYFFCSIITKQVMKNKKGTQIESLSYDC